MPHTQNEEKEHVFFNEMSKPFAVSADEVFLNKWDTILKITSDVQKALELKRADKLIGKSLEAAVVLYADGELYDFITAHQEELTMTLIVSQVEAAMDRVSLPGIWKVSPLPPRWPKGRSASAAGSRMSPWAATTIIPPSAPAAPMWWRSFDPILVCCSKAVAAFGKKAAAVFCV